MSLWWWETGGPIYPVELKPPSGIKGWDEWPEDVKDTLWAWNHGNGKSRLSFTQSAVFKCTGCEEFCRPASWTGAVLDGDPICDDCLIARARQATDPHDNCPERLGRPEELASEDRRDEKAVGGATKEER